MLIEDHVTQLDKHWLMTRNAYQLLMRTGLNSWYVSRNFSYSHSLLARLEYYRNYYRGLPLRKFRYA